MSAKKFRLSTSQIIKNRETIFHRLRWKYGIVVCPYCGSIHIKEYDGYRYKCNTCKNRFSDRTNTLMHGSKLSTGIWMLAIHEMVSDNFISSVSLSKRLGINQKSAWLLQMKLRYFMSLKDVVMDGVICMDEMYVGGCLSNFHYRRKLDLLRKNHLLESDRRDYGKDAIFTLNKILKTPVFGMTNGDKVVFHVCPNPIKKEHIRRLYKRHCKRGSITVSDESRLYEDWKEVTGSELYTNNHHNNQYVTNYGYTSNAIENRFSWYKRGFSSRIIHCRYHQLYLNEFCFRYNTRNLGTEDVFRALVDTTVGHHITYRTIKDYNPYYEVETKTKIQERERKERKSLKTIKYILEAGLAQTLKHNGRIYTIEDFK